MHRSESVGCGIILCLDLKKCVAEVLFVIQRRETVEYGVTGVAVQTLLRYSSEGRARKCSADYKHDLTSQTNASYNTELCFDSERSSLTT